MIIYKITNLVNNKIYIGQSNGKNKFYMGSGIILHNAIKKYGMENFKKDIIVEGEFNQTLLDQLEIHYIRLYNSTNKSIGYNIDEGGWGGHNKTFSEETRKKISEGNKRAYKNGFTKEHIEKISKAHKGIPRTEETKKKLSLAHKGKVFSEEHRLKLSIAAKNRKKKS